MANLTTIQKQKNATLYVPMFVDIFLSMGVNPDVIPFIVSQIAFETNWFSSNVFKVDHNPAGITWNINYKSRPGATLGLSRGREGGNYVHFDSYANGAKDLIRILSKVSVYGKSIDATDIIDYSQRLKANNYYTDSITVYSGGLRSINNKLDEYANLTALAKKKSNLTMAALPMVLIGLIVGTLIFKK
jgi:flagellum-specific peptidoglycan hydrolase FlgJ